MSADGAHADDAGPGSGARALRARLDALGFRPTKTLGQNFLLDPNLARAIAADARVGAGERVLEVGCGPGALSEPLAERGVELVAVEIDARLLELARERLARFRGVRFVHADALAAKQRLAPEVERELWTEGDWHLVANLPYAIAGPLLVTLARLSRPPRTMTVLVQAEVAERIAAAPGAPEYGALTARLAIDRRIELGRRVGPRVFWPRPRVDSAVVRLVRERELEPERLAAYDRLVGVLFQGRRKTVLNGLLRIPSVDRASALAALDAAGVDPARRPGDLGPAEILALLERLRATGNAIP